MLVIKAAEISTGKDNKTRRVNISINKEKISRIEAASEPVPKDAQVVDGSGCLVLPGAIDPHVHFNTPGYESHEDFAHGTRAAAAGGVTTVIDMPDTSIPPVTNLKNLEKKSAVIRKQAYVDYALWGGVSKNSMRDDWWHDSMQELHEAGVLGFKAYLISGMDTFEDLALIELGQVLQHAKKIGALVGLHAEEKDIIKSREDELKKQGKNSLFDFYFSRSDPAEKQGVAIGLHLARQTGCRLHIVHMGSGLAVEAVARAKLIGVDVSAETCPHYLHFTYKDLEKYGSFIKTVPIVKTKKDRGALWDALSGGTIEFVATDHAPCRPEEKKTGSCWTDYNGMPGVELMLPYLFSQGYMKKRLSLARLVEVTSAAAAKRFGLYPRKGAIAVRSDADMVIIDPSKMWKVDASKMRSKAKWTPFDGEKFAGKIQKTILRGAVVYDSEKGVVGKAGFGRWIKRESPSPLRGEAG